MRLASTRSSLRIAMAAALACGFAGEASAKGNKSRPTQVVPPNKPPEDKNDDLSDGGNRRGIMEITLGSAALGGAVALLGRGIWEIGVGNKVKRQCAAMTITDVACNRKNPGNGGYIAAGLSFALAVPFSVAGGLLVSRGAKINRAYKAFHKRQAVAVFQGGAHHAGIAVSLRF